VVLFLGCSVLASATQASVEQVTCGQVITADTTLSSDVGPCEGDGIVIGSDNVTLNLAGHSILGTSSASPQIGVVLQRINGARVRNGSVTGFDTGVLVSAGSANSVDNLVINVNRCAGIALMLGTTGNIVRANKIRANVCAGVRIAGAGSTSVQGNRITRNTGPGVEIASGSLNFSTGSNSVTKNFIADNGSDGVSLTSITSSQTVVGNWVLRNGGNGIHIGAYSTRNTVRSNIIRANALDGVVIDREPTFAHNNQIIENIARGSGSFDLDDQNDACGGGTWAGNQFLTRNQPCID
jgi:hypothetical protein